MRDGEEEEPKTPEEKLQDAIDSAAENGTVTLTEDVTMSVNLSKLVNLNLNGKRITGSVTITSDTTGTITISAGTITGNLTVDAKNATVNNEATVNGTITITDVASGTWNENISGNALVFEAEGKALKIANDITVRSLIINKNATVITEQPVNAILAKDVEVLLKTNENVSDEEAVKIVGIGSDEPVELNPTEPTADTEPPVIDESATKAEYTDNKLVLTVKASDDGELAELEVDHSLGKHSGTPEGAQLPEFTVPAKAISEFKATIGEQEIIVGSVEYADGIWTLTFSEVATNLIKTATGESKKIDFYLVVKDAAGNASGSMYDGSYKTVTCTFGD